MPKPQASLPPLDAYESPGPAFALCHYCGALVQARVWRDRGWQALAETRSPALGEAHRCETENLGEEKEHADREHDRRAPTAV